MSSTRALVIGEADIRAIAIAAEELHSYTDVVGTEDPQYDLFVYVSKRLAELLDRWAVVHS